MLKYRQKIRMVKRRKRYYVPRPIDKNSITYLIWGDALERELDKAIEDIKRYRRK